MNVTQEEIQASNYLIIVAHPDDAELGCGGSIYKWTQKGNKVNYIICTNGDKGTKDISLTSYKLAEKREEEQKKAASILNINEVTFLRHKDGELEQSLAFRGELTLLIRKYKPEIIITHDPWRPYLLHPDHRVVGFSTVDAIISARDHLFFPYQQKLDLPPHTPYGIYFLNPKEPDLAIDISQTIEFKLKALECFQSQLTHMPEWKEYIKNRASQIGEKYGLQYAEEFKVIRL
jgi:LmbE family N-acetylglucosaminyl deacetylase